MRHLKVSGAVRPLKWPLGVKWLMKLDFPDMISKKIIQIRNLMKIFPEGSSCFNLKGRHIDKRTDRRRTDG